MNSIKLNEYVGYLIDHLAESKKNKVVLRGLPGVGLSTIAEHLKEKEVKVQCLSDIGYYTKTSLTMNGFYADFSNIDLKADVFIGIPLNLDELVNDMRCKFNVAYHCVHRDRPSLADVYRKRLQNGESKSFYKRFIDKPHMWDYEWDRFVRESSFTLDLESGVVEPDKILDYEEFRRRPFIVDVFIADEISLMTETGRR
jgi:hypothetical protein